MFGDSSEEDSICGLMENYTELVQEAIRCCSQGLRRGKAKGVNDDDHTIKVFCSTDVERRS